MAALTSPEKQKLYRQRKAAERFRAIHHLENLVSPDEFLSAIADHLSLDIRVDSVTLNADMVATWNIILEDTSRDRKGLYWIEDCLHAWKQAGGRVTPVRPTI